MSRKEKPSMAEKLYNPINITLNRDTETGMLITTYFYPERCHVHKIEEITYPHRKKITYYRDGLIEEGH